MLGTTFAHGREQEEGRILEEEGIRDDAEEASVELIFNFGIPVALGWVNRGLCRRGSGGGTCTCGSGHGRRTMIPQVHTTATMLRATIAQARE